MSCAAPESAGASVRNHTVPAGTTVCTGGLPCLDAAHTLPHVAPQRALPTLSPPTPDRKRHRRPAAQGPPDSGKTRSIDKKGQNPPDLVFRRTNRAGSLAHSQALKRGRGSDQSVPLSAPQGSQPPHDRVAGPSTPSPCPSPRAKALELTAPNSTPGSASSPRPWAGSLPVL